nr:DNA methyltransferase [Kiritimatiellia bacterium]
MKKELTVKKKTPLALPSEDKSIVTLHGDTREIIHLLPDDTFQCVVTSPPYWGVRDYGVKNQIGAESDLHQYINNLVSIFREVRRVLRPDGTFWLNIGNTYTSGGRKWRDADEKNKGRAMS